MPIILFYFFGSRHGFSKSTNSARRRGNKCKIRVSNFVNALFRQRNRIALCQAYTTRSGQNERAEKKFQHTEQSFLQWPRCERRKTTYIYVLVVSVRLRKQIINVTTKIFRVVKLRGRDESCRFENGKKQDKRRFPGTVKISFSFYKTRFLFFNILESVCIQRKQKSQNATET